MARSTNTWRGGTSAFIAVVLVSVACSEHSPSAPSTIARTSSVGPQVSMTCPANAVEIPPTSSIQFYVDDYPQNTTFCVKAGIHRVTRAIRPKTGDTFIGEYASVLDGTGWTTTDQNQGAFRAHNEDIDNVTIQNLVIRNMPQKGIHAYEGSERWTVANNEIESNGGAGVTVFADSVVRSNYVHHNVGGGYSDVFGSGVMFENNEFGYNGVEQKITAAANVIFRGNFVHHNVGNGIWCDTDNAGVLIEDNRVEDNAGEGILHEASGRAVLRRNAVRRNAKNGIFISSSKDVQIYDNTVEHNFRAIQYFVDCRIVGGGSIGWDLSDVVAHDNVVTVGPEAGALANGLGHVASCSPAQLEAYRNGSKNLQFQHNSYRVPSLAMRYWFWGAGDLKSWFEWQALPQDTTGTAAQ